jgi:hypothetical protein
MKQLKTDFDKQLTYLITFLIFFYCKITLELPIMLTVLELNYSYIQFNHIKNQVLNNKKMKEFSKLFLWSI